MEATYYLVLVETSDCGTLWLSVWEDGSVVYVDDIKQATPFLSHDEAQTQGEESLQCDVSTYKIIAFTNQESLAFGIITS